MANATNPDTDDLGGSSTQGAEESGLGELMGGVDPGTTDLGDDSYRTPTNAGSALGGSTGGTTGGGASGTAGSSGGAGETGTSGAGTD